MKEAYIIYLPEQFANNGIHYIVLKIISKRQKAHYGINKCQSYMVSHVSLDIYGNGNEPDSCELMSSFSYIKKKHEIYFSDIQFDQKRFEASAKTKKYHFITDSCDTITSILGGYVLNGLFCSLCQIGLAGLSYAGLIISLGIIACISSITHIYRATLNIRKLNHDVFFLKNMLNEEPNKSKKSYFYKIIKDKKLDIKRNKLKRIAFGLYGCISIATSIQGISIIIGTTLFTSALGIMPYCVIIISILFMLINGYSYIKKYYTSDDEAKSASLYVKQAQNSIRNKEVDIQTSLHQDPYQGSLKKKLTHYASLLKNSVADHKQLLTATCIEKYADYRNARRKTKKNAILLNILPEASVALFDTLLGLKIVSAFIALGITSICLQTLITISGIIFIFLSATRLVHKPRLQKSIKSFEHKFNCNRKNLVIAILNVTMNARTMQIAGSTDLNGHIGALLKYLKSSPIALINPYKEIEDKIKHYKNLANSPQKISRLTKLLKWTYKLDLGSSHLANTIQEDIYNAISANRHLP